MLALKDEAFLRLAWRRFAREASPALATTSNQPPKERLDRPRDAERTAAAQPQRRSSRPAAPRSIRRRKLAGRSALVALVLLAAVTGSLAGLTLVYSVNLPQIHDLEHYRPSTTTDLYDRKGRIIGSFALERREVVGYDGFAPVLRQAVISIEDKNFESHWGINVFRVAGAAWHDIRSHGRAQGASTLTMQLARNLFLSSDRTAMRKIQEAYLAIQIERAFTKEQIFTLYGNQIYLGSGKYGFEAASEYFFSKHAKDLTLTEAALLAGLPKGPVAFSPLLNPERALRRRNLVLSEMESDGVITHAQAEQARNAPLGLHIAQPVGLVAPWFQEEVRANSKSTSAPKRCTRTACASTPRSISICSRPPIAPWSTAWPRTSAATAGAASSKTFSPTAATLDDYRHPDWAVAAGPGDYVHALVTRVLPLEIHARIGPPDQPGSEIVLLPRTGSGPASATAMRSSKPGDIIYVRMTAATGKRRAPRIARAGLRRAGRADGHGQHQRRRAGHGRRPRLRALGLQPRHAGRAADRLQLQALRLHRGYRGRREARPTSSSTAPVSFGGYTPHNYENDYKGAMTVANAFAESRNIPALKLAARVGIHKVIDVAHRFGVTSNIPPYLPVALGAVEITLRSRWRRTRSFPTTASASRRASSAKSQMPTASRCGRIRPP